MPYLIHIPPSHNLPRLHTIHHPTLLPNIVALSSTSTLDLTLTRDFKSWGWRVQYLDLSGPPQSASPARPCKTLPCPTTQHTVKIAGECPALHASERSATTHQQTPPNNHSAPENQNEAKEWYALYLRLDAKYHFKTKVFKLWQKEHGRRIVESQARVQESQQGWKDKVREWVRRDSKGADELARRGSGVVELGRSVSVTSLTGSLVGRLRGREGSRGVGEELEERSM